MNKLFILLQVCVFVFIVVLIVYLFKLQTTIKNQESPKNLPITSQYDYQEVLFSSEMENYNITLSNKDFLEESIQQLGFWDPLGVFSYRNPPRITANSLSLKITDKKLPDDKIIFSVMGTLNNVEVLTNALALNYTTNDKHVDFYIYLNPDVLATIDTKMQPKVVSTYIMQSLYDITTPPSSIKEDNITVQNKKKEFVKSLQKLDSNSFITFTE